MDRVRRLVPRSAPGPRHRTRGGESASRRQSSHKKARDACALVAVVIVMALVVWGGLSALEGAPAEHHIAPRLGQEWGLPEGQVRQDPCVPQGIVSCEEGVIVMSRQLFVWRMAPGPSAGEPCGNTPDKRDASRVHREISHPEQGSIDYTGALDYVFDELSHSRLRLGWGVANPELDVRLPEQIWLEHYRMACQKYRSVDPETSHAVGDRQVLCCLLEMSAGDVVFMPKSPDDGHFMVATVKRPYAFDRATVVEEADVRNDFRHVIGVEDTMRYAYGAGTLYPGLFEAPLREAIQRISEDDPSYRTLADFLRSWGR
jgi:hypothetical protein